MAAAVGSTEPIRWARDDRVLWREAPCALTVVLGPHADLPTSLRGTGAALWATLEQPATVPELAARLAHGIHADAEVVRRDIEPLVANLAASGALRPEP